MQKIDKLIINSPYAEPQEHWHYNRKDRTFIKKKGRRPAGYVMATPGSKTFDDPGVFVEIPLVNDIRKRVKEWRNKGYPGVTGITKRLLEHWYNPEERQYRRFFFCQLEAIETLIWLFETPAREKVGIEIPSDGGDFQRICAKMATGTGKTIVMSMLITWQILNKVTYPKDTRFSKNIFVVAPGLTVKSRLQVVVPDSPGNYYDEFNIVPVGLIELLRQGKVIVQNWHVLNWDTEEQLKKKRSVDKRGVKSDEAYVREVLGDMAGSQNIVVINDEAHHAWRVNVAAEGKYIRQRDLKESAQEATIWVGGLDRSVGMLSEGWDAKTVTHIMGLRAFSSQLLCEQVVGRGLRRTSYEVGPDGLFDPEYVNIFGVPFTFLPHEGGKDEPPPPPKPKTQIEPVKEKEQFAISWPNVIRVDHSYKSFIKIDFDKLKPIELDPCESITSAEMAAILEGKPNRVVELSEIDLKEIAARYRMQTIIFETAKRIYNSEKEKWQGIKEHLFGQLVGIVSQFIDRNKIVIKNDLFRN